MAHYGSGPRRIERPAGLRQPKRWEPVGYLFIAPAILLYLLFNAYPIVRTVIMSFQHFVWTDPNHVYFDGLHNYSAMLSDALFQDAFWVSVKFTAIALPARLILALLCAVLISHVTRRWATVYRVIVYLPAILPVAVSMRTWSILYDPTFGYPNYVLSNLGLNPPDWLHDAATVVPAFCTALVWEQFGFATLLFLIGIYNISPELLEAAAVDGAGVWRQFWSVILPLLRPMLALVLVTSLLPLVQSTGEALTLTQGGPGDASTTLGLYVYNTAFKSPMNLGYASAMNMTLFLFGVVSSLIVLKLMRATEG